MLRNYSVRTDLALEEKEQFESDNVEIPGVVLEEDYDEKSEIRVTRVEIETENGAKAMGKPVGTYLTLETPNLAVPDEESHVEIAEKLCGYIRELIDKNDVRKDKDLSVLVVGLGNREVTPDALGPYVADHLSVTRHIVKEYGKYAMGMERADMISAIVPGVMGQTGMESAEIVRGIIRETHPDIVIAVDALAARNSRRLNRTVQIADSGIHPGSGVGNHRIGMTRESLGVPVIGIGVPTVVDAATIVNDTMENFIRALESSQSLKGVGEVLKSYNEGEKYEFVKELIAPHLNGMFVTPKDVDEMVHHISHTISEAINMLFASGREMESADRA
ncbi:GPR endopeptidase [Clostridium sp. Marseille-P3244]|uniref:GPR endopeptidase n=1 Tax=Clostridium sp. Marseille-P3244 TaxID=1871020 RepID=UPI00092FFF1D|nr:GPR endopeptidase [Clostridium sp. Marseille-P3244]